MSLILAAGIVNIACTKTSQTINETKNTERLVDYVDPFIGTGEHGHTFPGATLPYGGVQCSPVNGVSGWDWVSGYHISDSLIVGFGHQHLSGTGIGDLNDILILPTDKKYRLDANIQDRNQLGYTEKYSHDQETAKPGYYSVLLQNSGIQAEVTTGLHTGFHRWTYPESIKEPSVVINLGFAVNWDGVQKSALEKKNENTIKGYRLSSGWAEDQRVYFEMKFSSRIKNIEVQKRGERLVAQIIFDKVDNQQQVNAAVGISSASLEGAAAAINQEAKAYDFDQKVRAASDIWENALSQIKVTTKNKKEREIFYTALYHTKIAPVTHSDAMGEYKGADHKLHHADGFTYYSTFSLWDTFRAVHPLATIVESEKRNADFINSMLAHFDETGLLPVWALAGNETNCMTGYHAMPVLADAVLKNIKGVDPNRVLEAMVKTSMQDERDLQAYKKYGFIPSDKGNESVTKTLEYAYDDWCIAQVAKKVGDEKTYMKYMKRSEAYKPLFDKETEFMRGLSTKGKYRLPFDPAEANHRENTDYTEGNAYQHSWFVLQDVQGLIDLYPSKEAFLKKLDELFTASSELTGANVSPDITGLIGQYAHGNEPSHHIAYLYNYAGEPWKTQEKVREIMDTQYDNTPEGIAGNEDCGQISAWYVFSALGFYPVNPAQGLYVVGSPIFEESTINTSNGKSFTVTANNVSEKNKYIQSITLNGEKLDRLYITHEEIMNGGQLVFEMSETPNKSLGINTPPPSNIAINI
ncbi:GH92 family glycosyl hydrolase [Flammeovirga agarivorans]|uniref:Glycoside hydrolase family 92 protein n=1 Tax=Flammeovirga agarivorans TaxID=2726742 RepID=A0A7X8SPT7_9BACT|nr:GH92 family glycosyl hydrolase [Flammeovirga agarivorans]NLR94166.1 glycoside hydrolase family 92 protein [Flammeovirga agarivorans]